MSMTSFEAWLPDENLEAPVSAVIGPGGTPMLSTYQAWRILEKRTGVNVGRSTFYRWAQSGRVFTLRMGNKILVPWPELEHLIKDFRRGVRI
jgi:hypothetical protein